MTRKISACVPDVDWCCGSWQCQMDILVVAYHAAALGQTLYLRNVDMSFITEADPESRDMWGGTSCRKKMEVDTTRRGSGRMCRSRLDRDGRCHGELSVWIRRNDTRCSCCVHVLSAEKRQWTPEVPRGREPQWLLSSISHGEKWPSPQTLGGCFYLTPSACSGLNKCYTAWPAKGDDVSE